MLYTCILVYFCQSQLLFISLLFYFERKRVQAVYLYTCILLLVAIVIYNVNFIFKEREFMLYTCILVYFYQSQLLFISLFFYFERKRVHAVYLYTFVRHNSHLYFTFIILKKKNSWCILVYFCQSQLTFIILLFHFERKRIHAVYLYTFVSLNCHL